MDDMTRSIVAFGLDEARNRGLERAARIIERHAETYYRGFPRDYHEWTRLAASVRAEKRSAESALAEAKVESGMLAGLIEYHAGGRMRRMVPVDQTQFRSDGHHGNCFQACVASILELPLEAVPNFAEVYGPYFMKGFRTWIAARGLGAVYLNGCAVWPSGAHSIATGKSPRGDFLHSVVWLGRKAAHDPHPTRDGIADDPHEFIILTAKP